MWPVIRYLSNRGRQADAHEADGHPQPAATPVRRAASRPGARGELGREPTVATGLLLEAIAREALGSPNAARQAPEHALGLAALSACSCRP